MNLYSWIIHQKRLRNWFFNIILLMVSFIVALLIGELFLRLFNPQPIVPRYIEMSSYGIRKNIGNVRGEMITAEYQHRFNTNSQGFRGNVEYLKKKPENIFRIIVLGDSVTLGHGVDDAETFSAIIEKNLSLQKPVEVINMGISGFGTVEELIQLRNCGFLYSPDLIIVSYFPNDPYNNIISNLFTVKNGELIQNQNSYVPATYIRDRLYKIPGYSFFCQHSHLLNFFRHFFSSYFQKKLGKENEFKSTNPKVLTPEQSSLTASLINQIIKDVGRRELPLIILNIPLISDGEMFSNLPENQIELKDNVHLIDVKECIYADHHHDELSYPLDCHPKPYAHKLIGDWCAKFIESKLQMN